MTLKREIRLISRDILFIVRLAIGFVLILIGLIGLIFPIAPDWILILIGLMFFDVNGKIANYFTKLLPRQYRGRAKIATLKFEAKIDKILGKWR